MTEKELAKKVWVELDKMIAERVEFQRREEDEEMRNQFGMAVTTLELFGGKLKEILPRPKRKVKKTCKAWVPLFYDRERDRIIPLGIWGTKEGAKGHGYGERPIQEVELSVEVEQ